MSNGCCKLLLRHTLITKFTLIDGWVIGLPNVHNVVLYKEHEGSFLVGVLAAMNSQTGTVGFVGGMDIPLISRFECGYKQGVAYQDSSMKVLAQYDWIYSCCFRQSIQRWRAHTQSS